MAGIRMAGSVVADSVKAEAAEAASRLRDRGIVPCLATVLVGDDPASTIYVRNKHNACSAAGIRTQDHALKRNTSQSELDALINQLNDDDTVHGILVQLPLPDHLDEFGTISKISATKDVDGLTPESAGLLAAGRARLVACTPSGIMRMLDHYGVDIEGKHVVIINRSGLMGKPLYHLMLQRNATVTTCHSRTKNLDAVCRTADIVVTGVGNGIFELTPQMIRQNAIVIDVAINRAGKKLRGDADYAGVLEKASYITPVPGGVGLMTVAMLLWNTVVAAGYET